MIDVDYDYERPDFFCAVMRKAAKTHQCSECGGNIEAGTKYEVATGKWDKHVQTFKTCPICVEIRDGLFNHYVFGSLWEDLREEMRFGAKIALHNLSKEAQAVLIEKWPQLDEKDDDDPD